MLNGHAQRASLPVPMRTLVVGAGHAGRTVARDMLRSPDYGLCPIGFLDDEVRRRRVDGLPVLGPLSALEEAACTTEAQAVVIAIPALPAAKVRELADAARRAGATVRVLPSFLAAVERDARVADIRSMRIDQLLGRPEVHVTSRAARDVVRGRRVLVTGAGGSIGSELCRQIRGCAPAALYMLDHDESNLHQLQLDLTGEALLDSNQIVIADIRDGARIDQVFATARPEVVFHAAAHKHLPLLEMHPCEGVKSNVLGTHHLVQAAVKYETEAFVYISTDKAADPTSVLGATKRLGEMILAAHAVGQCRFGSVRFGNVLGSRGSLLAVLSDQMSRRDAVTVTHPDVTRYFMTTQEAVGLVLEAAAMAMFGETFVLDMGEPVRIADLVLNYAAQLHLQDIEIRYTGLRPGEKLHEVLFSAAEEMLPTPHPKISATYGAALPPEFLDDLDELLGSAARNDAAAVLAAFARLVPGYDGLSGASRVMDVAALQSPYPDGF